MVYARPDICPGEWDTLTPLEFWHTNGSPNLGLTTRLYNNQQQNNRTCKIVDFAVLADHRVKLKENEKKDKYLELAREWKKLWNMKVTIIPIVIGALSTINKRLVQGLEDLEIRGPVETIKTIIEIGQNTEKSPGDLRKLAVTQTPVRDHQLTLMWKSHDNNNSNNAKLGY